MDFYLRATLIGTLTMLLLSACSSNRNESSTGSPQATASKAKNNSTRNKIQQFISDNNHANTANGDTVRYAKARASSLTSTRPLVNPTQAYNQPLPLVKASITQKDLSLPLPLIKASAKPLSYQEQAKSNSSSSIASQPAQQLAKAVAKKPPANVMTAKQTAEDNPIITNVGSGLTLSASLQPNVDFWIKVFAKWDLRDFVYHDDQYLKIIYKTVQASSKSGGDKIADSDRKHLKQQKSTLQKELKALELAVSNNTPLSQQQKRHYDQIVAAAGKGAISGISERLRYQRGQRSRYLKGLKIEAKYIDLFKALFKTGNVPHGIAYLPHVESSFRNSVTSSANATGMWQFTKGAKDIFMIKSPAVDERMDPVASARGAVRYMQAGYRYLDSWPLAVTSYNHGIGGMRKAKKAAGPDLANIHDQYRGKNFGFASRNFYPELIAVRYISHNRDKYFGSVKMQSPLDIAAFILPKDILLKDLLAQWQYTRADLEPLNAAILDPGWRSSSPLPKGFIVWLPKQALGKISGANSTRDINKLSTAMLQALPEPKL